MYLVDSRDRDTAALVSLNLQNGDTTLIAENPHADVSDTMVDPNNKNIQAVAFTHERKTWIFLDENVKKDLEYLESISQGEIEIVSQSFNDEIWIVAFVLDDGPVRFYKYNRPEQQASFLFTNRDSLTDLNLSNMHSTTIKSRDNFDLISYYTLPSKSSNDSGIPDSPCPTVLLVHGGPWHRDTWGYSALHQMLSNRGYAVLSVNFRGSTGFGKAFINAANLEWGRNMHNDLIDAVNWAIDSLSLIHI